MNESQLHDKLAVVSKTRLFPEWTAEERGWMHDFVRCQRVRMGMSPEPDPWPDRGPFPALETDLLAAFARSPDIKVEV